MSEKQVEQSNTNAIKPIAFVPAQDPASALPADTGRKRPLVPKKACDHGFYCTNYSKSHLSKFSHPNRPPKANKGDANPPAQPAPAVRADVEEPIIPPSQDAPQQQAQSSPLMMSKTIDQRLAFNKAIPYRCSDKVVVNALTCMGVKAVYDPNIPAHTHALDAAIRHTLMHEAFSFTGALYQRWHIKGASLREIRAALNIFTTASLSYDFVEGVSEDIGKDPSLAQLIAANAVEEIGPAQHILMVNMYHQSIENDEGIDPNYIARLILGNRALGENPLVHWIGHIHVGPCGSTGAGYWVKKDDLIYQYPDLVTTHYSPHPSFNWLLTRTGVTLSIDNRPLHLVWKIVKTIGAMSYVVFSIKEGHFKIEEKTIPSMFVQVGEATLPILPHARGIDWYYQYAKLSISGLWDHESREALQPVSGNIFVPLLNELNNYTLGKPSTPYAYSGLASAAQKYLKSDSMNSRALNILRTHADTNIVEFTIAYAMYQNIQDRMLLQTRLTAQNTIAASRMNTALVTRPTKTYSPLKPVYALFAIALIAAVIGTRRVVKRIGAQAFRKASLLMFIAEWVSPLLEEAVARIPKVGVYLKGCIGAYEAYHMYTDMVAKSVPQPVSAFFAAQHILFHLITGVTSFQKGVAIHYIHNVIAHYKHQLPMWFVGCYGWLYVAFYYGVHKASLFGAKSNPFTRDILSGLKTPHAGFPCIEDIGIEEAYSANSYKEHIDQFTIPSSVKPFLPALPPATNLSVVNDVPEEDFANPKKRFWMLYLLPVPVVAFDNNPVMLAHALNQRVACGNPLIQSKTEELAVRKAWEEGYAPWEYCNNSNTYREYYDAELAANIYRTYIRDKPARFKHRVLRELEFLETHQTDVTQLKQLNRTACMVKTDEVHFKFEHGEDGLLKIVAKPRLIANVDPKVTAFCGPAIVWGKMYLDQVLSHTAVIFPPDMSKASSKTVSTLGTVTYNYKQMYKKLTLFKSLDPLIKDFKMVHQAQSNNTFFAHNGVHCRPAHGFANSNEITFKGIPIRFEFVYAASREMSAMCMRLNAFLKKKTPYHFLCWIQGDDKLMFYYDHKLALHVIEEDYKLYDASQSVACHKVEKTVRLAQDFPPQVAEALYMLAQASYVADDLRVDFTDTIQRKSGGPNTSDGNSIVTAHSTAKVMFSLVERFIMTGQPFTDSDIISGYKKLGLTTKLKHFNTPFFGPTFLKGILVDRFADDDTSISWVRLPSVVILKSCKAMTNPMQIFKGSEYECRVAYLHTILQSTACEGKDPLTASLHTGFKQHHPNISMQLKDPHMYSHLVESLKPHTSFIGIDSELSDKWLDFYEQRYGLTETMVYEMMTLLLNVRVGITLLHPGFLKLAEVDYG